MNIGRWRRAFSARSTAPRPMIGSVLAVHDTTTSNSCRRCGMSARRMRLGAEAAGQLLAALQRAVGQRHRPRLARGEMRRHQFDHLAGAHEQHPDVAQVLEQLRRQAHRRGGHADRVRADLGGGAHLLGHRERTLEQLVQRGAQRAGGVGLAHRLLHLARGSAARPAPSSRAPMRRETRAAPPRAAPAHRRGPSTARRRHLPWRPATRWPGAPASPGRWPPRPRRARCDCRWTATPPRAWR